MKKKDLIQFLAIAFVFMGGFFTVMYYVDKEPTEQHSTTTISTEEAIDQHKRNRYGEPKITTCSWCAGTGVIGAGESEKQVRRTGMGMGNKCTSCGGTGKIKTYPNE